jgi:hypothetical protein
MARDGLARKTGGLGQRQAQRSDLLIAPPCFSVSNR